MSGLLVALFTSIIKALGQEIFQGILQALKDEQARRDQVALGQQQQATATANQTAKTVADESQAEADAPKDVGGVEKRLGDGTA